MSRSAPAMTDWTIVVRSLRARLFSTIVTGLTVAVAVALLLVLLTMRRSGKAAFERGAGDMHLLVGADASPLTAVLNNIFFANPPRRPLAWARVEQLKGEAPWAYAVAMTVGDSFRGFAVCGTTTEYFSLLKPAPGEEWRFAAGEAFRGDFEVVLGATAARRTGLKVGDRIAVTHGFARGEAGEEERGAGKGEEHAGEDVHHDSGEHVHDEFPCTVVGVLAPTGGAQDRVVFVSLESLWIIHAHDRRERADAQVATTTAADLTDEDRKVTGVYLRLTTREGSDAPANLPAVFDQLRRDTSLTVAQPKQEIDKLFAIVGGVDRLFLAIALVVLASSGVAILLALYNSMEQRKRQIAIVRVLGASRTRVMGLVLTESALIGVMGAAAGVAMGTAGSFAAAGSLKERLGIVIEPVLSPTVFVTIVGGTVVLACVAGLIPALVAYRVSVAENLRPRA